MKTENITIPNLYAVVFTYFHLIPPLYSLFFSTLLPSSNIIIFIYNNSLFFSAVLHIVYQPNTTPSNSLSSFANIYQMWFSFFFTLSMAVIANPLYHFYFMNRNCYISLLLQYYDSYIHSFYFFKCVYAVYEATPSFKK